MTQPDSVATARPSCLHGRKSEKANHVECSLSRYGGRPHQAICRICPEYKPDPTASMVPVPLPIRKEQTQKRQLALSAEKLELVALRSKACASCEHNRGLSHERNGWPVHMVRCNRCGCPGLSLVTGDCPEGRWQVGNKEAGVASTTAKKLVLRSFLSPGDIVMLTATVRDLHLAYPNRFITAIETSCAPLWENNPYVAPPGPRDRSWQHIDMHYPLINQSNQGTLHFIHGYHEYLGARLNLRIPVSEFKGDLHLSEQEKSWQNQVEEEFGVKGPFWILMGGGKYDFTTKWWSPDYYQRVVDHFLGRIQFVQCGDKHHWHPELKGVCNLIGKTSIRQFVRLVYHAEGVICPITFAMHLAAAVPPKQERLRPCVVIAGGREPPQWEAYPAHQFLHTIGCLPCCSTGGCWRSRCQPVGDGNSKDKVNLCERPVQVRSDLRIPQCMMMIKPEDVIRAIERYLHFNETH